MRHVLLVTKFVSSVAVIMCYLSTFTTSIFFKCCVYVLRKRITKPGYFNYAYFKKYPLDNGFYF